MMLSNKLSVKESLVQWIFTFQLSNDTHFSPYRSRHKANGKPLTPENLSSTHGFAGFRNMFAAT